MTIKSLFTKINSWSINYQVMFILICLFQCFTYIVFNSSFDIRLNGDAKMYIGFLENLYQSGTYEYKGSFSGRMPGFLPLYSPLRLLFSQYTTLLILIFIQLIIYSFAVTYFIKKLSAAFSWNGIQTLSCIALLGFTNYISVWGNVFYTESLAASCLMVTIGLVFSYENDRDYKKLILAGTFLTWLVFLRPYMIVFGAVIILHFFINFRSYFYKSSVYLMLPLGVLLSLWIIRNYTAEQKFIPLQSSIYAGHQLSETQVHYRKFLVSFGGDMVKWNPGSEGQWFQSDEYLQSFGFKRPAIDVFPASVFDDQFTKDSLLSLRLNYWSSIDTTADKETRKINESIFCNKVNSFVQNHKEKNPLDYYVMSKMRILKSFIVQPYTYTLSIDSSFPKVQLLLKIMIYALSCINIIVGLFSLLLVLFLSIKNRFENLNFLLISIPLYILTLFPLYFGLAEYRFLVLAVPIFPILIIQYLLPIGIKTGSYILGKVEQKN